MKPKINVRSLKCVGYSAIFHMLLLTTLYLLMIPAGGQLEGNFVAVSLESELLPDNSTPETGETFDSEDYSRLTESARELEQTMPEVDDTAVENYRQKIADQQQNRLAEAREKAQKIAGNISERSKYGPLDPGTFYGIKVFAHSAVFVLDISGSIDIREAKIQLRNAYHGLKPTVSFTLITYADDVQIWQGRTVPANEENKSLADKWVENIRGGGGTNIYGALQQAFVIAGRRKVDTIYFMTDGLPTVGVDDPQKILEAVKSWNRGIDIEIHVVGLGAYTGQAFLQKLAEQNGGDYYAR